MSYNKAITIQMVSGQLNEIVSFLRPVSVESQYSAEAIKKYVTVIERTRANVKYQSGNRTNDNNEIFFATNIIFTVHNYLKIKNGDWIVWRGDKYRILSIENQRQKMVFVINTEKVNE